MPGPLMLVGGSEVQTLEGPVGTLARLVVDPRTKQVTHIAVEPPGHSATGRLVPVDRIQSAADSITLDCSNAEFAAFGSSERSEAVPMAGRRPGSMTLAHLSLDDVPAGEVALSSTENVRATDGEAGRLLGLTVDEVSHEIAQVLLEVGHLFGKRRVSIPVEFVRSIDVECMDLALSKEQIASFQSR